MRILITGGAGFIGSHLTSRLTRDGHAVAVVDDLSSGSPAGLSGQVAEFYRLDVATAEYRQLAARWRPEVVCHLAAQISVRASVAEPIIDARINVLGTVNVLEAARIGGTRKVVFASSAAVYGTPPALPVPRDAPLDPRSPYAASKACGETYLSAYRLLHALDFTTLTLANVYGPGQRADGEAGVVAIFADALLRGKPTRVFGDGTQTRDYVYVGDVADAFARACGELGGGRRFNIGTGIRTSDVELHSLVAAAARVPSEPAYAPSRPGDLPDMALDPADTQPGLGWAPVTGLCDGIKVTVDWLRMRNHRR